MDDMVSLSLLGLPKSWHSYQGSFNGREKLPDWEQLWLDLIQEEIRRNIRDGSSSKTDDEENCALAIKAKKGKGKLPIPNHIIIMEKPKKKYSRGAACEALASQFNLDFSFIACMVLSMMGSVWYLDSGASFKMTHDKELFSDLEEKYLQMHIEMGDEGKYSVTRLGTITFQMEHGAPLTLKNVIYVPGLKKNLVSISILEDRGYYVIFSKGKAFL
eukprot:PITA_06505